MKPLIIYGAPSTSKHCKAILDEVKAKVKTFDLIDLYKLRYDPVMQEGEHYTAGGYKVTAQNKTFQKMISKASKLIFIYPMWWYNMPAILKGFMDRVFVARYAFKYENGKPIGLLKNEAVIFVTSGGPSVFYKLVSWPVKYLGSVLKFCGIKSKVPVYGSAMAEVDLAKVRKMVSKGL